MEIQRGILLGGLLITAFLLFNAWKQDYPAVSIEPTAVVERITDVPMPAATNTDIPSTTQELMPAGLGKQLSSYITVTTDVLSLDIDPRGGNIVSAKLLKFLQNNDPTSEPVEILSHTPGRIYIAQSGLSSEWGPDTATKGQAVFRADAATYDIGDKESLSIPLYWSANGIDVVKTITLKRGSYLVDVEYQLKNNLSTPWSGQFYGQFKREPQQDKKEGFLSFSTYNGAAISTPAKRYEKITYKEMDKTTINRPTTGGWVAMLQHYFVSAWIPAADQQYTFTSYAPQDDIYRLAMLGPTLTVAAGQVMKTGAQFYVGPEITSELKKIAPGLELTVDYGWFWPISQALFWVLKQLYHLFSNWGYAIIGTTILVKLVFYKLSATSYRSMARMRSVQPKIEKIKERCGDDKQKMSQEMMNLYKTEKINPLGGCLPVLVQIPVFIALYWVLIESVELRHAPFVLWIHDLSAKDPYYVLPIIMGLSMLVQQRLSPAPADPMQAKVLMLMPIMFTAMFLSFPAGLVLYWVVNNVLSIAQQWMIMRSVEKGLTHTKP